MMVCSNEISANGACKFFSQETSSKGGFATQNRTKNQHYFPVLLFYSLQVTSVLNKTFLMQKNSYVTVITNLLSVDCEIQGHPLTKQRIHLHNLKLCVVMASLMQKPASKKS